jgi:hypothetical protein
MRSTGKKERMVRDAARGFAQDYVMPRVIKAWRDEKYDPDLLPEMGKLPVRGDHSGRVRRRRPRLCRLRPDHARARARRFHSTMLVQSPLTMHAYVDAA